MANYNKSRSQQTEEESQRRKLLHQEGDKQRESSGGEMVPPSPVVGDPLGFLANPQMTHPANAPLRAQAMTELQRQQGNTYVQQPIEHIRAERGSGHPLGPQVRAEMEVAFRHDFSNVKIHTDSEADKLCRELGAQAFTTGNDVFFKEGAYKPWSEAGKAILGHELAHATEGTAEVQLYPNGEAAVPGGRRATTITVRMAADQEMRDSLVSEVQRSLDIPNERAQSLVNRSNWADTYNMLSAGDEIASGMLVEIQLIFQPAEELVPGGWKPGGLVWLAEPSLIFSFQRVRVPPGRVTTAITIPMAYETRMRGSLASEVGHAIFVPSWWVEPLISQSNWLAVFFTLFKADVMHDVPVEIQLIFETGGDLENSSLTFSLVSLPEYTWEQFLEGAQQVVETTDGRLIPIPSEYHVSPEANIGVSGNWPNYSVTIVEPSGISGEEVTERVGMWAAKAIFKRAFRWVLGRFTGVFSAILDLLRPSPIAEEIVERRAFPNGMTVDYFVIK